LKYIKGFWITILVLTILGTNCIAAEAPSASQQYSVQALIAALKFDKSLNFCGEPVPIQENEIKERLERELLLCLDDRDEVILWIKRANRFFPHIEKTLKKYSMPDDFKYLAIAESALKPLAASNKGAVGYWQFIESTGSRYGMEINPFIDERRNFFTSTDAAFSYLKDLYAMFGSWTLSAAAYNMGEEGLKTEILVQKVNNYYKLYLPQETQRYIFRILAIKQIMSNPEKYGFILSKDDLYGPVQSDLVDISSKQQVPIFIIAQAANTYYKVIKDLNPHLRNYYLPPGKYQLSIPKGTASGFSARFENLLQQWLAEKKDSIYIVRRGDNLSSIAARFNIPVKAIMIWNSINNGKKISPGDKLIIFSKTISSENNGSKRGSEDNPTLKMP
jgi:LysM repeat protein